MRWEEKEVGVKEVGEGRRNEGWNVGGELGAEGEGKRMWMIEEKVVEQVGEVRKEVGEVGEVGEVMGWELGEVRRNSGVW